MGAGSRQAQGEVSVLPSAAPSRLTRGHLRPSAAGSAGRRRLVAAVLAATLLLTVAVVVGKGSAVTTYRHGWRLLLQDEFRGDRLDPGVWNAEDLPSSRNHELQYYTPDLITVGDGHLRLSSERVPRGGQPFSSAAVDTYGKFSFTYGRVEVRAQLPAMGQGIWPAVWLLGTGCNPTGSPCAWPTAGSNEIDIMEAVNLPTRTFTNLHHGTTIGTSLSTGSVEHTGVDVTAGFHTFAVEWEPGGVVRWYRDHDLLAQRTVPGSFDQPMSLIINTAVGGDWPGAPADDTPFPQHFDVDFVRVYQRP
jgi:beta-glucanase (GH16 family)